MKTLLQTLSKTGPSRRRRGVIAALSLVAVLTFGCARQETPPATLSILLDAEPVEIIHVTGPGGFEVTSEGYLSGRTGPWTGGSWAPTRCSFEGEQAAQWIELFLKGIQTGRISRPLPDVFEEPETHGTYVGHGTTSGWRETRYHVRGQLDPVILPHRFTVQYGSGRTQTIAANFFFGRNQFAIENRLFSLDEHAHIEAFSLLGPAPDC